MAYAIMRFEKLKSGSPINGSVSHITRSRSTPNADPDRRHLNRAIVGEDDPAAVRDAIEERTPAKFRRDAVRALEFVITATPGWFRYNQDQTDAYFDSAVEWLREQFGAANVVCAVQHNDESTPHMHALVVPLDPDTGRLNAKRWVGGRGALRQMQSEFADWQSQFGVERGKARPGRKHTRVQEWYDGHAQLDERQAEIERERAEFEAAREEAFAHAEKLEDDLEAREKTLERASAGLSEREKALDTREGRVTEQQRQAELQAAHTAAREDNLAQRETAADERAAAEAARLERLRVELQARGDDLAQGEAALVQRQAEIDRAGRQLRERLDQLRKEEQTLAERVERIRAWAEKHRPEEVDDLADIQGSIPASMRDMAGADAADWHDAGLDALRRPRGPRGPGE